MTNKECETYFCHSLPLFRFIKNENGVLGLKQVGHEISCASFWCEFPETKCRARN